MSELNEPRRPRWPQFVGSVSRRHESGLSKVSSEPTLAQTDSRLVEDEVALCDGSGELGRKAAVSEILIARLK